MNIDFLVLGSTGMLGQALIKEAQIRNKSVIGIARKNADICIDVTDRELLYQTLSELNPKVVINTVAIVNLKYCQENPDLCREVNGNVCVALAQYCSKNNKKYIFISTDHYFTDDTNKKHSEEASLNLCNEYAISKQLGEQLSLVDENALVIRTNIVGFRQLHSKPTFVEWALSTLEKQEPMQLFNNVYTSSIDVNSFSKILFDLIDKSVKGVINVASSEVTSKSDFISAIASRLCLSLENTASCSMNQDHAGIVRNESLGLDVSKVEKLLGYSMPSLNDVINSLANQYFSLHPHLQYVDKRPKKKSN